MPDNTPAQSNMASSVMRGYVKDGEVENGCTCTWKLKDPARTLRMEHGQEQDFNLARPITATGNLQYVSSPPHKWLARTQRPFPRPRIPASLPTVMKDLKPRQRRRAFVLSQDKNQLLEAPLSKRAGKQPVYYDIPTSVHGMHTPTSFQQLIERRAHHGEVVIRRGSLEDWGPEYQRLQREEQVRQLREAVARVAHEDKLEGRLTTIILDFIAAVRSTRAHQQRVA